MTRLILPRRRAMALSLAPMIASGVARAQGDWPNKPVRYITGFPPGGPTDTLSRIVCAELSEMVEKLAALSQKALESRKVLEAFDKQGATAFWMSPADTAAFRAADERKLAPVIKASGAKVE